jgi:hypothetical protein
MPPKRTPRTRTKIGRAEQVGMYASRLQVAHIRNELELLELSEADFAESMRLSLSRVRALVRGQEPMKYTTWLAMQYVLLLHSAARNAGVQPGEDVSFFSEDWAT